jgi:hypothetical protein
MDKLECFCRLSFSANSKICDESEVDEIVGSKRVTNGLSESPLRI